MPSILARKPVNRAMILLKEAIVSQHVEKQKPIMNMISIHTFELMENASVLGGRPHLCGCTLEEGRGVEESRSRGFGKMLARFWPEF